MKKINKQDVIINIQNKWDEWRNFVQKEKGVNVSENIWPYPEKNYEI